MANILHIAKNILQHIPEPIGRLTSHVPFRFRLGSTYTKSRLDNELFNTLDEEQKIDWLLPRLKKIVHHAYTNTQFYKEHYDKEGFSPHDFKTFDDFKSVPVVSKDDLQLYSLSKRSHDEPGKLRINTGGTSGQPLEFYIDKYAFPREWAHMHIIWERLGYRPSDLKLTFRGKNHGKKALQYNAVHNEYSINTYAPMEKIIDALMLICSKKKIKYIHGYPSAIYEFIRNASIYRPELIDIINTHLKGVLLGSEFPAPQYRKLIDEKLNAPSISWYGHSEMAILAKETTPYHYTPMHTYGYTEAIKDNARNQTHLVGTSLYNTATPFIRYDTSDLISTLNDSALLASFSIKEGRTGDFIIDANGEKISLTALIFGRHHEIFETARFIQIFQDKPGVATLFITMPENNKLLEQDISNALDLSNINIKFIFRIIKKPLKTKSGKTPLLILKKQIPTHLLPPDTK